MIISNKWMRDNKTHLKPCMIVAYSWLIMITVIAVIFGGGVFVPVDPRTGLPLHGVHLSFPVWGSLIEPFTALFHIMETVPDYKRGILSILTWILFIVFICSVWLADRRGERLFAILGSGFRAAITALFLLLLYLAITLTSHFPNWSLQKDGTDVVVADLHSHSLHSHDGVISARENLRWHQQRGYDVVAFTDHVNAQGPFVAYRPKGEGLPAVIHGIEIPTYYGAHFYFTALGMDKDTPLPNGLAWREGAKAPLPPASLPPYIWYIKRFIKTVHQHHGVVITVALHLDVADVVALTKAGVDGFEYINSGHEPLPESVRQALLTAQRTKGVVLLASNDWHGWTGALNAWTLFTPSSDKRSLTPKDIVLDALRQHDTSHIIPAVSYPVHVMTWFEIVMAPFTSIFLYAKTLSFWQLLSWWVWVGLCALLVKTWQFKGISPSRFGMHAFILTAGIRELWDGVTRLPVSLSSSSTFLSLNFKIIYCSFAVGFFLVFSELFIACRASAGITPIRLTAYMHSFIRPLLRRLGIVIGKKEVMK